MLKVHDKDEDVSKANENDVMKKEAADTTPSEAEIQDVIGKDEQFIGNTDIKAEVTEKEDSAEDDLGNRCVKIICGFIFSVTHHVLAIFSVGRLSQRM